MCACARASRVPFSSYSFLDVFFFFFFVSFLDEEKSLARRFGRGKWVNWKRGYNFVVRKRDVPVH